MRTIPHPAYAAMVGKELGVSRWIKITQDRIDRFAACTGDRQFIHTDPARAAGSVFGTTIAQGFLLLSMIAEMTGDIPAMADVEMSVNYGLNRVRFTSPVTVGSRIRGRFVLADFQPVGPAVVQTMIRIDIEVEHGSRPALVAEWLVRRYLKRGPRHSPTERTPA